MSLDYIRTMYDGRAEMYRRVRYTGDGPPMMGTIVGARDASLLVRLDCHHDPVRLHPTWKVAYLNEFQRPPWAHRQPAWPRTFAAVMAGEEPADALTSGDRRLLVARLWEQGMTDVEVAEVTRMTMFSSARIRTELDLPANVVGVGVGI